MCGRISLCIGLRAEGERANCRGEVNSRYRVRGWWVGEPSGTIADKRGPGIGKRFLMRATNTPKGWIGQNSEMKAH